jgi:hypothetical protein
MAELDSFIDLILQGRAPKQAGVTIIGYTALSPAFLALQWTIDHAAEQFVAYLDETGGRPRDDAGNVRTTESIVHDLRLAANTILAIETVAAHVQGEKNDV